MINAPFVRSPYNYDVAAASDETGTANLEPSLCQANFQDECDINYIMERFGQTGELPSGVRAPFYGDFTGISDYHGAVEAVRLANEAFESMPPDVRSRFFNDPGRFVEFCNDPKNLDEMRSLGLASPLDSSSSAGRGPGSASPQAGAAEGVAEGSSSGAGGAAGPSGATLAPAGG